MAKLTMPPPKVKVLHLVNKESSREYVHNCVYPDSLVEREYISSNGPETYGIVAM